MVFKDGHHAARHVLEPGSCCVPQPHCFGALNRLLLSHLLDYLLCVSREIASSDLAQEAAESSTNIPLYLTIYM